MWAVVRKEAVVFPAGTRLLVVACTEDETDNRWLTVVPHGSVRLWTLQHTKKRRPVAEARS